jgi:myo-inositol-1(or 4)-monophosphatase
MSIERLLIDAVQRTHPEAAVLSEETHRDFSALDAEVCYVIDPIDNTDDLIAGRTGYAISVAMLSRRHPVGAFLDFPARDQRFLCYEGSDTALNNQPVHLRAVRQPSHARIAVSASQYRMPELQSWWHSLGVRELVPTPGFTAKVAAVLAGECDATLSPIATQTTYTWDYAAAALLLAKADATLRLWDGTDALLALPAAFKSGWLATTNHFCDELRHLVSLR